MRYLSLILLAVLACFGRGKAATISGTVTDGTTSLGAPGITIYLYDSSTVISPAWAARDSAVTSSTGSYSFTYTRTSGTYALRVNSCGMVSWSSQGTYTGSNQTVNLTVCGPVPISGTISYTGAGGPYVNKKVYLLDSSASTGVVYRDSAVTNASGFYSMAVPVVTGAYRIRVFACGTQWTSASYNRTWGSVVINLALGCSGSVVTDTVKNSTTGAAVYGQKVYLVDSSAASYRLDSALSNRDGIVYFVVPPGSSATSLRVYTNACGVVQHVFAYAGVPVTAPTLQICLSSAVISGTVTNASTGTPVAGWIVKVTDSSGSSQLMTDSAFTNGSGFYAVPVPVSINSGSMTAATQACGARITNNAAFSGSNLTLNLSVCASSTATISGTVTSILPGGAIAGQKVYLYDSTAAAVPVIYRDSTVTNASGGYSFTIPPTKMRGNFRVSTPSCGGMSSSIVSYTGYSQVRNFSVYSGTPRTISGTVYNRTGVPAGSISVQIYIPGSGFSFTNTNPSGGYTFSIPCATPSSSLAITIYGPPCGTTRTISYTGSSISGLVDTLCYLSISGVVRKQGSGAASNAKVYLIEQTYDTTFAPPLVTLVALDSTVTNSAGRYHLYPPNIGGAMRTGYKYIHVKAALQASDPSYSSFMPTYLDSSLIWSGADTISWAQASGHDTTLDISLRAGVNPGGPGFIGGNVLVGANKRAGAGDPMPGKILLLTNAAGEAISYTYSDASGKFSFSNLALGSYRIFGDAWGKSNPPLLVTLTTASSQIPNVLFEENDTVFKGTYRALGVPAESPLAATRLYPNPASERLYISGLTGIKGSKSVCIYAVTGAVMMKTDMSTSSGELEIKTLPAGVYMLELHTSSGVANYRFVKN